MDARRFLTELWSAALAAVDPEELVAEYFREHRTRAPAGRLGIFASGKAAARMVAGVPRGLLREALVVVPRGTPVSRTVRPFVRFASHPDPDRSSLSAAKAALAFFRGFGERDLIFALVSGGTSSLLCLPRPGVTLATKRKRVREAMQKGWAIERLNRLRTSLSRVKGGRLGEATDARVVTLVLSDVPGADFRIVGSGPTVSRRKKRDRAILLGENRTGLEAAAGFARSRGFRARIERDLLSGEASEAGRRFASRLCASSEDILLAGGETTVRGFSRAARGGRSQEFSLGAAAELASRNSRCTVLSAGSDGIDGNSNNAGAFADGATTRRARERGLDPDEFLRRHASAAFFDALGESFCPGPTGGNVADWVFGVS